VPGQYPQGQADPQRQNAERGAGGDAVEGELIASIGENRKTVIFPLDQVPEMTARAAACGCRRYKDGGLSDVKTFKAAEGLTWWTARGRSFTAQR
jgi:topoisomerase-4 subunit A